MSNDQPAAKTRERLWTILISAAVLCVVGLNELRHGPLELSNLKAPVLDDTPFHWQRCDMQGDSRFLCGRLAVPLDYTNASDPRRVHLAVTMFKPHLHKKSTRTLMLVSGKPGTSGTELVWEMGQYFSKTFSDSQFDIIGWDHRGVNMSEPHISCFPEDMYRDRWKPYTSLTDIAGYDNLVIADALNEATMKACKERYDDIPRFLSTAFIARDMDAIREALHEDEVTAMLSDYGTLLGQTYIQMFPNRAGRIAMNGIEYLHNTLTPRKKGESTLDNVTDAFHDGLLGECVSAGPSLCALAESNGTTLASLSDRMTKLLANLRQRPIPGYTVEQGPGIIVYEQLISAIYAALYTPRKWTQVAQMLAELERGNASMALQWTSEYRLSNSKRPVSNPSSAYKLPETHSLELSTLVSCADSYDAEQKELTWWNDLRRNMTQKSWLSGNQQLYTNLPCRHFDWKTAEVYRGVIEIALKTPVLLINSIYDPLTPLRGARQLASDMKENARLVIHNGYGHLPGSDPSRCAHEVVKLYIKDGIVPENTETQCYPNRKPYQ